MVGWGTDVYLLVKSDISYFIGNVPPRYVYRQQHTGNSVVEKVWIYIRGLNPVTLKAGNSIFVI